MTRRFKAHAILLVLISLVSSSFFKENNQSKPGVEPIKIGLLVTSDTSLDYSSRQSAHAAILAIEQINKTGGINGRNVELIVKSSDGKWGTGSKQAVDLVYEEKVQVIIGALDGKNAHLAEQVATKAQVVFLSTKATDPTLSQINIPWFFRSTYNDDQRAEALVQEVDFKSQNLIIISEGGYDNDLAEKSLLKKLYDKGLSQHQALSIDDFIQREKKEGETVIYFGGDMGLKKLIPVLNKGSKFYGSAPGNWTLIPKGNKFTMYVPVFENLNQSKMKDFISSNNKRFKNTPGIDAAYTFDGFQLIFEVIKSGKYKSQEIQKSVRAINYQGATGTITFDKSGNRIGKIKYIPVTDFHSNN